MSDDSPPTQDLVIVRPEARQVAPIPDRPADLAQPAPQVACPHLSAALALARDRCEMAVKDKRNEYHKFNYASADEVITVGKAALKGTELAIIPQLQELTTVGSGNATIYALNRTIFLSHSSGEFVPLHIHGWPVIPDKGRPLDKAFAVALTSSLAYLLRDLLQMPRGDEADMNTRDDRDKAAPRPAAQQPRTDPPAKSAGLPTTGAELHRRLREADADLASKGVCQIGSLLAHVTQAGVKAGFGADLTQWHGPAIELAVHEARAFKARLPAPKPAPADDGLPPEFVDSEDLRLLLGKSGLTWEKACEELAVKLDRDLGDVELEKLSQPDRRELLPILQRAADDRKAKAREKAGALYPPAPGNPATAKH